MYLQDRTNIENFKPLLADYLISKKGVNINKPFRCLNPGHDDKHPSMSYTGKYNICKCFSCGVSYDLFDLIGIDYNIESFKEKLNIANELYPNIELDVSKVFNVYENSNDEEIIDFSNYFKKCKNKIDKTDYLLKRNINPILINKYEIGYDDKRDMIIFPINKNCYFGRGVSGNLKFKSKGISYLWNEDLLKDNDNNLIYITESIIDSLSLETIDPDVKTIALNGLPNYKRLLKVIEENDYKGHLVLAFDNDKKGLTYQEIVKSELAKLNVRSFCITLISNISEVKDLNEALITNKELLEKNYKYFDENLKKIIERNKESELSL